MISDASFNDAKSAPFSSSANATLTGCHSSTPSPMVFRNFFNALSITLDDKEDHIKVLTTLSSSPTSVSTSHVSAPPQHVKNKCQTCKTLHSKPKPSTPLTKQPTSTAAMRSSCSSMEKQPSPMGTANSMVFNPYHQNNFGRRCHSSKVSHTYTIPCHSCKSHEISTPHSTHFHVYLCDDPHIVSTHPHETALHTPLCCTCMKILSDCTIFPPHFKTVPPLFRSLPCMATQTFFSTIPLLTFSALAFTVITLLLLCNINFSSSTSLSWLSFRYQMACKSSTSLQPYVFDLLLSPLFFTSSLFWTGFTLIPPTPTKFHHHLGAWIHSTPVSPGSRPLSSHFGGTTAHGFYPKYPSSLTKMNIG